jgi:hypothetical protein
MTSPLDAVALLERADPVDVREIATEADVAAARERVRSMIAADAPSAARPLPRRVRRRWLRLGGGLGVGALAGAVVVALGLLGSVSTGPEVPNAAAMTIRRAAEAVRSSPGSVLHIDLTLTSSYPTGEHWSVRQDLWQQQRGTVCSYLNLEQGGTGTPSGTEGGTVDGRAELYDPIRNTIYVAPPVPSRLPSPPAGRGAGSECSFMAGFAAQVRGLLSSARARVEGRVMTDGKSTIEIVSGSNRYYVAADGSYAPVELVNGKATDRDGMTTSVFHAYQRLPAAAGAELLNLSARHPTASVDNSLAGYRAAIDRLFPDG